MEKLGLEGEVGSSAESLTSPPVALAHVDCEAWRIWKARRRELSEEDCGSGLWWGLLLRHLAVGLGLAFRVYGGWGCKGVEPKPPSTCAFVSRLPEPPAVAAASLRPHTSHPISQTPDRTGKGVLRNRMLA